MTASTFRSLAWGFHQPGGCVLWWQVAPTHHLRILSELCFEQWDEADVASAVKRRDADLGGIPKISYTVSTPTIIRDAETLKQTGFHGEMVAERLARYGIICTAADADEINGWKRCQSLLRTDATGTPWLTIDPACVQLVRAITTGLRDEKDADDVRDPSPALTAFRYGAMSRPSPDTTKPKIVYPIGTPGYIMQQRIREARPKRWGLR